MSSPRVAVLCCDALQRQLLKESIQRLGFDVVFCSSAERLELLDSDEIATDVWIVAQEDNEATEACILNLLVGDVPVLVGMEPAPDRHSPTFMRWEKKLLTKLRDLTHSPAPAATVSSELIEHVPRPRIALPPELSEYADRPAEQIWVLGASLGGPEAVKGFLDALPEGLPVAFVYAQHIDERFEQALCQAVGRHSAYRLRNLEDDMVLASGDVLIAPVTQQFDLVGLDRAVAVNRAWEGPYGPSIDGVIEVTQRHAKTRFGCILFSGMGSDGSEAIMALPEGTPVWVQTPATCGNASMPESAMASGRVTFIGDTHQLALQLVQTLKRDLTTQDKSYERHPNHGDSQRTGSD